jgi:ferrous-iron efflux pump FieF
MDGGLSLDQSHIISDAVERDILAAFPNAEVIIHADPEGVDEERQEF